MVYLKKIIHMNSLKNEMHLVVHLDAKKAHCFEMFVAKLKSLYSEAFQYSSLSSVIAGNCK